MIGPRGSHTGACRFSGRLLISPFVSEAAIRRCSQMSDGGCMMIPRVRRRMPQTKECDKRRSHGLRDGEDGEDGEGQFRDSHLVCEPCPPATTLDATRSTPP